MEATLRGDQYVAMLVQINKKTHDVVESSPTGDESEEHGQQQGDNAEEVDDHITQSELRDSLMKVTVYLE